jgi:DNA polymerase-1
MDFLDFSLDEDDKGPDISRYDIILVDGMNLLHRAAHSYAELGIITPDGDTILTGATYGFINLIKVIWERYSSHECKLIICWDGGYKHRTSLYADYKASRRNRDPDELEDFQRDVPNQRRALTRILKAAGWAQAIAPGYEADDVMATIAHDLEGKRLAIYTMDQDLHQCVTATTHVVSPQWGSNKDKIWTPAEVEEKWGVTPDRVPEVKAFAGDSSDNIPGCPGCGKGWARKFLATSQVQEIIDRADEGILTGEYDGKKWRTPSLTKKIQENRELILISWELAKTVNDVPVLMQKEPPNWDHLRVAFDKLRFYQFLEPANFKVLQAIAYTAP